MKMETRYGFFKQLREKIEVIAVGAANGTAVRLITWPLEKSFYDAALKGQQSSYRHIYRHNFQPQVLFQLTQSFFKTGFWQTVLKSAANIGVINYIDHYHFDLTANEKSVYATALCTPWETLFTCRGEYYKVKDFSKMQNPLAPQVIPYGVLTREFSRVISATFVRVLWSSLVTFGGIYKTTELFQQLFPQSSSHSFIKPAAALVASFALQPAIMPIINYQTYVLNDPRKSLYVITKEFIREQPFSDLVRGSLGRGIHRGAYYSLTFFIAEKIKSIKEDAKELPFETALKKR